MKKRSKGNCARDYWKEEFENEFVRPAPGRTLICGSRLYGDYKDDRRALYEEVVGVDQQSGPGVDLVADLEVPPKDLGKFSHVECLSVLEHAKRPWLIAQTIERCLLPGGTLYVIVPFVWRVHAYPDDYWRFTASGVRLLFQRIRWQQIGYLTNRFEEKIRGIDPDGYPAMPRSEVIGFGSLR